MIHDSDSVRYQYSTASPTRVNNHFIVTAYSKREKGRAVLAGGGGGRGCYPVFPYKFDIFYEANCFLPMTLEHFVHNTVTCH